MVSSKLFRSFATIKFMEDLYVITAKMVKTTKMKKELAKAHFAVRDGPFSSLFSFVAVRLLDWLLTSASHNLFPGQFEYSFRPQEHRFYCAGNGCKRPPHWFRLPFRSPRLCLIKRPVLKRR